jgi:hypothetical protein
MVHHVAGYVTHTPPMFPAFGSSLVAGSFLVTNQAQGDTRIHVDSLSFLYESMFTCTHTQEFTLQCLAPHDRCYVASSRRTCTCACVHYGQTLTLPTPS